MINNLVPYGGYAAPYSGDIQQGQIQVEQLENCMRQYLDRRELAKSYSRASNEDALWKQLQWRKQQLDNSAPIPMQSCPGGMMATSLDGLPSDLDLFVSEIAREADWEKSSCLMGALACTSAAMCGCYTVQVDSWTEPVALYMLILADSGSKKSTVFSRLTEPLKAFENERREKYYEELPRQRERANRYEHAIKTLRNVRGKAAIKLATQNGFVETRTFFEAIERAEEQDIPILAEYSKTPLGEPRLIVDACSTVGLLTAMSQNGEGQALFMAEGDSFFEKIENRRNLNKDILLKAYGMESLTMDTGRKRLISMERPFLNMLVMSQPLRAKSLYAKAANLEMGLAQRFIPHFVQKGMYYYCGTSSPESQQKYSKRILSLLERNYTQAENRQIFSLALSADAQNLLAGFQCETSQWLNETPIETLRPFIAKLAGTAIRLAATLHAWRHEIPEEKPISYADMHNGIQLARMSQIHAHYAFAPQGLHAYASAKKILEFAQDHNCYQLSSTDIAQHCFLKRPEIFPALNYLQEHRALVYEEFPSGRVECLMHANFRLLR